MLLKVFSVKLGAQASCLQNILQPLVQAGSLRSRVKDAQNLPPIGKNYENTYNGRVNVCKRRLAVVCCIPLLQKYLR